MKNSMLFAVLVLLTLRVAGQEAVATAAIKPHQLFVHYYPSDLIAGNIVFGMEHLYKKRFAHELSLGIRALPTTVDNYNKVYRLDYLVKYNLYNGKIFRFSTHLSLAYRDNYSVNRPVEYSYQDASGALTGEAHLAAVENRHVSEYGAGLGVSLNFKVCRKFFVGTEITCNRLHYDFTHSESEVINGVQSTAINSFTKGSGTYAVPYIRVKLSYLLGRF